jgi:Ca-activated chloride channel homolog
MRFAMLLASIILFIITLTVFPSNAQHLKIEGKVVDKTAQNALPGVYVFIKGTKAKAVTDAKGQFVINVPDTNSILVFSFIGYSNVEKKVGGYKYLYISMEQEISELEEAIVVGYGVQKKADLTGSIVTYEKASAMTRCQAAIAPTYYNPSIESYSKINENGFKNVQANPLSTFSVDVDKASYSNIRRFINNGQLPPKDAVRIEEMINYFDYNYPQPKNDHPIAIVTEYSDCPWQTGHKLLHIGLQGKKIALDNLPSSNLVFLIDVSGSMESTNKLPLLKNAFKLLVKQLRDQDHVAICVYAGAAGLVLPSTHGNKKEKILEAIDQLEAGGSTAGAEGIRLAYQVAQDNLIP